MQEILNRLGEVPEFQQLLAGWQQGKSPQLICGASGSQRNLLVAGLQRKAKNLLVVTAHIDGAQKVVTDLSTFLPDEQVLLFPPANPLPFGVVAQSPEVVGQRLAVLEHLYLGKPGIVVTPIESLAQKLVPLDVWQRSYLALRPGMQLALPEVSLRLVSLGYERTDLVEGPGQFSIRGGIIDVYTLTHRHPFRIEMFDDEIESIRQFEVTTQRSISPVDQVIIGPARELVVDRGAIQRAIDQLSAELPVAVKHLKKRGTAAAVRRLTDKGQVYLEKLGNSIVGEEFSALKHLFFPKLDTLFDYLSPQTIVCLDEPLRLAETMEHIEKEISDTWLHLVEDGATLPNQQAVWANFSELMVGTSSYSLVAFTLLPKNIPFLKPQNLINVTGKPVPRFIGQIRMLADEIRGWQQHQRAVVLLVSNASRADYLQQTLWEYGIIATVGQLRENKLEPGQVLIREGLLESGFAWDTAKLVVLTEKEIFGEIKKPRRRQSATTAGARIETFTDLKVGDYVVHVHHGIGRYQGVEKVNVGGVQKDYLLIQYQGEDRLYVPTDQVDLIQKYIGSEGVAPRINRLGGTEWARAKAKVKESVREMAKELLELYAAREALPGFQFSPDTVWQQEFEAAFPYEETPDQLQSIEEVKQDMMKPRPMDRLLCGDVGYGKTEVAIRAAFKAVMDSKQVAVLVPTTVLAQQHHRTFCDRFAGYPVNIEVISRFKTPKEQKQLVERIADGSVDIVIGTHRLLSDDIKFHDLGLLIVDEEQRFGVAHKEKLKRLKQNVDVLTLTATPIPRTLHMSLVGVRDMSIIETPPEDRFPVQTFVVEYSPELVREVIRRELRRGGQVFFVHNRITDLDRFYRELRMLVPEARLGMAHGQMREDHLERVMLDFINGEYDVLICTSIIESGLDIPNVNTLIVSEADHLGLSQLYQLRGRVGRSNRLAYAYFTYRKDRVLSESAEKRLQAIREFTEFGSGFKIALRDLEIRGAGNILGAEQHGHMAAVGFDLYNRLLEEAVLELKGQKPAMERTAPTVELPVDTYIPDDYIPDARLKMELYKRIILVKTPAETDELSAELRDRYGPLPPSLENLICVTRIKALAQEVAVASIQQEKDALRIRFTHTPTINPEKIARLTQKYRWRLEISQRTPEFIVRTRGLDQQELLGLLEGIFWEVKSLAG